MTDRPDPFGEIEQFLDEFVGVGNLAQQRPPADVIDTGEKIIVQIDLPGRDPDTIDVQLEENRRLQVTASAVESEYEGQAVNSERQTGEIERRLVLPAAVEEEDTTAGYEQGVLTVRLPKLDGSSDGTDIPVN